MADNNYQKTTIEKLAEYAKLTKRKIVFSEIAIPTSVLYGIARHKREVVIQNNEKSNCYYVCYKNPESFNEFAIYCGLFIPISISPSTKLNIKKKDILDKLNPFLAKKCLKIGNSNFDSKVIITSNNLTEIKRLFSSTKIQNLVLKALNIQETINIGINEIDIEFSSELKGKTLLGIYNKQRWIVDSNFIEDIFKLGEEFNNLLNK